LGLLVSRALSRALLRLLALSRSAYPPCSVLRGSFPACRAIFCCAAHIYGTYHRRKPPRLLLGERPLPSLGPMSGVPRPQASPPLKHPCRRSRPPRAPHTRCGGLGARASPRVGDGTACEHGNESKRKSKSKSQSNSGVIV
jgi:hypothetical protein